jgi:hypothetical protein
LLRCDEIDYEFVCSVYECIWKGNEGKIEGGRPRVELDIRGLLDEQNSSDGVSPEVGSVWGVGQRITTKGKCCN